MRVRGIAVAAKLVLSFVAAAELSVSWFATRVDYFRDGSVHVFLSVIRGLPLYPRLFTQIPCYERDAEQVPGKFLTALDIAVDSCKRKG
jgi:hypothetical protein